MIIMFRFMVGFVIIPLFVKLIMRAYWLFKNNYSMLKTLFIMMEIKGGILINVKVKKLFIGFLFIIILCSSLIFFSQHI